MANIIWEPQPAQTQFMKRAEYEVVYGGAAGGGKSDAMVIEALRQVNVPNYKALILRRTYKQLGELILKSQRYYPRIYPGCKYNDSKHTWVFRSGARIEFGGCEREGDWQKYLGFEYDFIGFDELTHFTQQQYDMIKSRNRASGAGTRVYTRSTTNPGGIGHAWVKDRFITIAPPYTRVEEEQQVTLPTGGIIKVVQDRVFIPATVFDNQKLLNNNPGYLATLASLPEQNKKAMLYGDWDSFEGQVFMEWKNDPDGYNNHKWTHVIKPFNIPETWKIYRGYDFGYAKPFSFGWYAVSKDGTVYRIAEYYGCTGVPNVGVKMDVQAQAKECARLEREHSLLKGKKIYGIADPAIFAENGGDSVSTLMAKEGIYFDKGDHERIAGKMQFHNRFAFDENGKSMFYVFDTCKHFIRTIPQLIYDAKHVEDIDSSQEDHIYDECRYVLMAHPISARENVVNRKNIILGPLDKPQKPKIEFYGI